MHHKARLGVHLVDEHTPVVRRHRISAVIADVEFYDATTIEDLLAACARARLN